MDDNRCDAEAEQPQSIPSIQSATQTQDMWLDTDNSKHKNNTKHNNQKHNRHRQHSRAAGKAGIP